MGALVKGIKLRRGIQQECVEAVGSHKEDDDAPQAQFDIQGMYGRVTT